MEEKASEHTSTLFAKLSVRPIMTQGLPDHCLRRSTILDTSELNKHGLGGNTELRKHNDQRVDIEACQEARQDWLRYIGPTETFASANPYHGNFFSLVLPYTQPERVAISAYFMECKHSLMI